MEYRVALSMMIYGKLGDEEQTIQVTEGGIVEFRWSSDEELSLHMHGYKIEVDVTLRPAALP